MGGIDGAGRGVQFEGAIGGEGARSEETLAGVIGADLDHVARRACHSQRGIRSSCKVAVSDIDDLPCGSAIPTEGGVHPIHQKRTRPTLGQDDRVVDCGRRAAAGQSIQGQAEDRGGHVGGADAESRARGGRSRKGGDARELQAKAVAIGHGQRRGTRSQRAELERFIDRIQRVHGGWSGELPKGDRLRRPAQHHGVAVADALLFAIAEARSRAVVV